MKDPVSAKSEYILMSKDTLVETTVLRLDTDKRYQDSVFHCLLSSFLFMSL